MFLKQSHTNETIIITTQYTCVSIELVDPPVPKLLDYFDLDMLKIYLMTPKRTRNIRNQKPGCLFSTSEPYLNTVYVQPPGDKFINRCDCAIEVGLMLANDILGLARTL